MRKLSKTSSSTFIERGMRGRKGNFQLESLCMAQAWDQTPGQPSDLAMRMSHGNGAAVPRAASVSIVTVRVRAALPDFSGEAPWARSSGCSPWSQPNLACGDAAFMFAGWSSLMSNIQGSALAFGWYLCKGMKDIRGGAHTFRVGMRCFIREPFLTERSIRPGQGAMAPEVTTPNSEYWSAEWMAMAADDAPGGSCQEVHLPAQQNRLSPGAEHEGTFQHLRLPL